MRRALVLLALAAGALLPSAGCGSLEVAERLAPVEATGVPAPPLEMTWRRDVDGGFGPAPGVAAGPLLLVSTRRGDVTGVDRTTGRTVGQQRFGDSVEGAAALGTDGRTLFVPVAGGGPGVVAYDARTGQTRWRWPARGASSEARRRAAVTGGVVRVGSTVVAGTTAGVTVGLDAATGAVRWQQPLADTTAQIAAPPVALGADGVLVADTRGGLTVRDAATGAVRWTASVGEPVYEAPAVSAAVVAVATTRGRVAAFDAATGRARWAATVRPLFSASSGAVRLSAPALAAPTSRFADGLVVVGGSDGAVRAFDAAAGTARWTWSGDGAVSARPLVADGLVYVGSQRKRLVALDAATGAERWSTELAGRVRGAPVAAEGTLYVFAEPRHVYAFRPATR